MSDTGKPISSRAEFVRKWQGVDLVSDLQTAVDTAADIGASGPSLMHALTEAYSGIMEGLEYGELSSPHDADMAADITALINALEGTAYTVNTAPVQETPSDEQPPRETAAAPTVEPVKVKRDYGMERFERLRHMRGILAERIDGIFWYAEMDGSSYQTISARLLERIHKDPMYKKLPRHDHSYLEGIIDSRRAEFNRRGLLQQRFSLAGEMVTTIPEGRAMEACYDPDAPTKNGLYWIKTGTKYI